METKFYADQFWLNPPSDKAWLRKTMMKPRRNK